MRRDSLYLVSPKGREGLKCRDSSERGKKKEKRGGAGLVQF